MIDMVLAQPWITQREIAKHFGMTESWVSVIFNSEAFREHLAQRKDEILDPVLKSTIEDRLRSTVDLSLEILQEKLREQRNGNLAVRVLEHGSRALGYGARPSTPAVTVQQYVAVVPAKALDAQSWAHEHGPAARIEATPFVRAPRELDTSLRIIEAVAERVETPPPAPINEGQIGLDNA
jgi:hypothetical protein